MSALLKKLITNDPAVAAYAIANGVGRIMVDIERQGKAERQAGRSTVISDHHISDVARIRAAVPSADILLRINPWHADSPAEISAGIAAGATQIMLPMVSDAHEVAAAAACARDSGIGIVPLIETPAAMARLPGIVRVAGLSEVYIGLNDLHLGLGLAFMFEIVAGGLLDHMAGIVRDAGLPFGFGGIATLGAGAVPAELVLAEHRRLGSTRVILSRAFSRGATSVEDFRAADLGGELRRIDGEWTALAGADLTAKHRDLQVAVRHHLAALIKDVEAAKAGEAPSC
jgi:hypothetical protein